MQERLREQLYNILNAEPEDGPKYQIAKEIIRRINAGEKLNSTEIAAKTFVSKPTVTRFAQSFGFFGFKEFANTLIKEDKKYYYEPCINNDTYYEFYRESLNEFMNQIDNNKEVIEEFAKEIYKKNKLFIFSSSENFNILNDFTDKLKYIGIEVWHATNNKQIFFANHIKNDDVALFIISGFENETLVGLWKLINPFSTTFLLTTKSQKTKFTNPNYELAINVSQQISRIQIKHFMMSYALDQLFNCIIAKDKKLQKILTEPRYRA